MKHLVSFELLFSSLLDSCPSEMSTSSTQGSEEKLEQSTGQGTDGLFTEERGHIKFVQKFSADSKRQTREPLENLTQRLLFELRKRLQEQREKTSRADDVTLLIVDLRKIVSEKESLSDAS